MKSNTTRGWLAYPDFPEQPLYFLDKEEQLIGRGEGCHIIVDDRYVSRRQAKIYWKAGLLILEDYGHNPILLNGEPIREVMLKDGDMLTIGSKQFIVRIISAKEEQQEFGVHENIGKVENGWDESVAKSQMDYSVKSEKVRKGSFVRSILLALLAVLICILLLYGAFLVYEKVLLPIKERHTPKIDKPTNRSFSENNRLASLRLTSNAGLNVASDNEQ